jgi:hypothetical protein
MDLELIGLAPRHGQGNPRNKSGDSHDGGV